MNLAFSALDVTHFARLCHNLIHFGVCQLSKDLSVLLLLKSVNKTHRVLTYSIAVTKLHVYR